VQQEPETRIDTLHLPTGGPRCAASRPGRWCSTVHPVTSCRRARRTRPGSGR